MHQGQRTLDGFEATARNLPAPKPTAELVAMEKALAAGHAALEAGNLAEAIEALQRVIGSKLEHAMKGEARDAMAKIEAEAGSALAAAALGIASDPIAAHEALTEVATKYRGSETGAAATRKLRELEASEAYQAEVAKREGDVRNARWLEEAKLHLEAAKWLEAWQLLSKIAGSEVPGAAVDEAKRLKADLEGDPEKMKAVREAEAESEVKRVMSLAKNYVANGAKARAIEKLEEVAKKYEGTAWAKKALEMADQIRKGQIK